MTTTTTWNPMTHSDYDTLRGKDVYSADGEKVGSISQIFHPSMDMPEARGRHYFLLDPGLLKEWFAGFDKVYLPESAIQSLSADRVVLNMTSEQIKNQGKQWTTEPSGLGSYRRA
jgi:sporulation protein YlmC with PRC-barrel domain